MNVCLALFIYHQYSTQHLGEYNAHSLVLQLLGFKKKKRKAANKASLSSDLNNFITASNSHYKPRISRHCCKQDSLVAR